MTETIPVSDFESKLPPEIREMFLKQKRQQIENTIKIETDAISRIEEKIKHYSKTGNHRKLAIYQANLEEKNKKKSKV